MTAITSAGTVRLADDLVLTRMGYGAMQLAGPMAWGPPKDRDAAKDVLRELLQPRRPRRRRPGRPVR